MFSVTVLYPKTAESTFDMDYYLGTHIPLVKERLTPMGLTGVDLRAGIAGAAPDTPPAYAMVAQLHFDTPDALQAAMGTHGPELVGDIPNFTNVQPQMQISHAV
jgi:uncharacterized protein (TIGR02118 family)